MLPRPAPSILAAVEERRLAMSRPWAARIPAVAVPRVDSPGSERLHRAGGRGLGASRAAGWHVGEWMWRPDCFDDRKPRSAVATGIGGRLGTAPPRRCGASAPAIVFRRSPHAASIPWDRKDRTVLAARLPTLRALPGDTSARGCGVRIAPRTASHRSRWPWTSVSTTRHCAAPPLRGTRASHRIPTVALPRVDSPRTAKAAPCCQQGFRRFAGCGMARRRADAASGCSDDRKPSFAMVLDIGEYDSALRRPAVAGHPGPATVRPPRAAHGLCGVATPGRLRVARFSSRARYRSQRPDLVRVGDPHVGLVVVLAAGLAVDGEVDAHAPCSAADQQPLAA